MCAAAAIRHVPVNTSIVGVQKAATTTLFDLLHQHQEVCPGPRKEWHFFDDERREWASPDYTGYHARARRDEHRIAIDATPSYLFWPHALERMRAYDPAMRLIASFRDPVERAFSQWSMHHGKLSGFPTFSELVHKPHGRELLDGIPPGWGPPRFRRRSLLARGLYGAQLERGFALFDPQQWLLLDFDDIVARHETTCAGLAEFLGLGAFRRTPEPEVLLQSRRDLEGPPPTADDVLRLVEAYADDLALFTSLSGLDTSSWSTSRVLAGTLEAGELAEALGRRAGLSG